MNVPTNSDSQPYTAAETGNAAPPAGYSPAVPISVYRELATELKTTQTTLDALTQQNQQLLRQNKLLRTEIQRFVHAAEQLGHFAGVTPQQSPVAPQGMVATGQIHEQPAQPDLSPSQAKPSEPAARSPLPAPPEPVTPDSPPQTANTTKRPPVAQHSAIVPRAKTKKRDRPDPPRDEMHQQRLFTEQQEGLRPLSKMASRSELGNLWLATTILLVVVSAFGAGFLIMRPLLNR